MSRWLKTLLVALVFAAATIEESVTASEEPGCKNLAGKYTFTHRTTQFEGEFLKNARETVHTLTIDADCRATIDPPVQMEGQLRQVDSQFKLFSLASTRSGRFRKAETGSFTLQGFGARQSKTYRFTDQYGNSVSKTATGSDSLTIEFERAGRFGDMVPASVEVKGCEFWYDEYTSNPRAYTKERTAFSFLRSVSVLPTSEIEVTGVAPGVVSAKTKKGLILFENTTVSKLTAVKYLVAYFDETGLTVFNAAGDKIVDAVSAAELVFLGDDFVVYKDTEDDRLVAINSLGAKIFNKDALDVKLKSVDKLRIKLVVDDRELEYDFNGIVSR